MGIKGKRKRNEEEKEKKGKEDPASKRAFGVRTVKV